VDRMSSFCCAVSPFQLDREHPTLCMLEHGHEGEHYHESDWGKSTWSDDGAGGAERSRFALEMADPRKRREMSERVGWAIGALSRMRGES